MWISKREYNLLTKNAEYWREKYEDERKRAHVLTDTCLQTNGLPPVSVRDDAIGTHPTSNASDRARVTLAELFENEIKDKLEDDAVVDVQAN